MLRFSLVTFVALTILNLAFADGGGHHHHVIIHVPYKIHTIHHTITKHVHHHDKGGEDKYEVIGYTVGKPLDLGHHFGGHELQAPPLHHQEHDFGGGNELGHDWAGGGNHIEGHIGAGASHEFAGHGGYE